MGDSQPFPCTSCGACCRRVGVIASVTGMNLPVKEDGSCAHLVEWSAEGVTRCAIYDERPDICRVGYAIPDEMDLLDYHKITAAMCNAMQEEDEMEEVFRIHPNDLVLLSDSSFN